MSASQKVQQHPMFVQAQGNISSPKHTPSSAGPPSSSSSTSSTPSPCSCPTSSAGPSPRTSPSKPSRPPAPQDDIQWLTYWVVFGFFNFLESFALRVVLYYLPWYFAFKTVFILWLQLPAFRGAQTTYLTLLKPVLANVNSRAVAPTTTATATDALHQE
ncbi:TB2/DP1, HVA22 family-domain-containing protein [Mycena olivaceomarginata]|nr:TB2/DP1, HVA22 family-domain-containing protein [Mycena olivaceomarginata]